MKKSNFVAMILGTIGMVFFALGMCMALIEEWGIMAGNYGRCCRSCNSFDHIAGMEKNGRQGTD